MPVPTTVQHEKNIWVAAGDGDLARVTELVDAHGLSPNAPDPYTYTPMHAAASYGQLAVLEYLVAHGGDVNVADGDGDTPLYAAENIETARWLVEHGAAVARRNNDGLSPAEHLAEDFPDVAAYLHALDPAGAGPAPTASAQSAPSQHAQDAASERLTAGLLRDVQAIMQRADAAGRDPDAELRAAVGQAVLQGVAAGFGMARETEQARGEDEEGAVKRARTDEGGAGPG